MRRSSYIALIALFLVSCARSSEPLQTSLVVYRFDPSAFLEFSEDYQLVREIPFTIPPNCGLFNTFPAPVGSYLLIELSCPNGQTVLFLDLGSTSVSQPVSDTDSHFLAWTPDGNSVYLKVDSLGDPRIVRMGVNNSHAVLEVPGFTYDLAVQPATNDFTFTLSRGLGYGSETYFTENDGQDAQLLYKDQYNYISFARFSPDGRQIAFIKTPDIQTPFVVGELWIMNADGSEARKLADVDSGHGYAANWSPDGKRIAFVVRENPTEELADRSTEALVSNIYVIDVATDSLVQVTYLTRGRVETPYWSPMGNTLVFNEVLNGRMTLSIADMTTGEIYSLETDGIPLTGCCPAWMRKRE